MYYYTMSWYLIKIIEEEVGVWWKMIYMRKVGTVPTEDWVYTLHFQASAKKTKDIPKKLVLL